MPKPIEFLGLSFIDLFAGAFGAILILYIIVPKLSVTDKEYLETIKKIEVDITKLEEIVGDIKNKNPDLYKIALSKIIDLRKKIEEINKQNKDKDNKIAQLEQRVENLQKQLNTTSFIFFTITWSSMHQDVDLWVIDPSGVLFNYRYREHSNHPGLISADAVEGPGVEAWIIVRPRPGQYKFYVNLYTKNGNPQNPQVVPQVYTQYGLKNMRYVTLYNQHQISEFNNISLSQLTFIATIVVNNNGNIEVQQ